MAGLAGLVSSDSRTPLQRLRRAQLWQIAERENLTFPAGAPAKAMYPILEAAGISGTEARFNDITHWQQVVQQDEGGGSHVELYPDPPKHHTADKELDYDTAIESRAATAGPEEKSEDQLFSEQRITELEKRNAELQDIIDNRLTALEQSAAPQFPLDKLLPWQLKHMAKDRGIEYKGLSKEELLKALGG